MQNTAKKENICVTHIHINVKTIDLLLSVRVMIDDLYQITKIAKIILFAIFLQ